MPSTSRSSLEAIAEMPSSFRSSGVSDWFNAANARGGMSPVDRTSSTATRSSFVVFGASAEGTSDGPVVGSATVAARFFSSGRSAGTMGVAAFAALQLSKALLGTGKNGWPAPTPIVFVTSERHAPAAQPSKVAPVSVLPYGADVPPQFARTRRPLVASRSKPAASADAVNPMPVQLDEPARATRRAGMSRDEVSRTSPQSG